MHRYLAAGAWLSHKHMVLEIRASPHSEFGRSSNGTGVIKEIRVEKKLTHRVPPFKITQGQ